MWKGKSKFSTYLYMVTMNTALDYLNSAGYNRTKNSENSDNLQIESQNLENSDLYSLKQAINILKYSESVVIELYYFKQLKEKEIAVELNKSINTISSFKYRALQKMKNYLKEFN